MIPINNMTEALSEEEIPEDTENTDGIAAILVALDGEEGTPTRYELEEWKDMYGVFYISSIGDDDDLYIWRTLKRLEYKQLIKSGMANDQMRYEESILVRCSLWPKLSLETMAQTKAGVVETLAKQVLYKSGFVSDQTALSMIKVI